MSEIFDAFFDVARKGIDSLFFDSDPIADDELEHLLLEDEGENTDEES